MRRHARTRTPTHCHHTNTPTHAARAAQPHRGGAARARWSLSCTTRALAVWSRPWWQRTRAAATGGSPCAHGRTRCCYCVQSPTPTQTKCTALPHPHMPIVQPVQCGAVAPRVGRAARTPCLHAWCTHGGSRRAHPTNARRDKLRSTHHRRHPRRHVIQPWTLAPGPPLRAPVQPPEVATAAGPWTLPCRARV